jgi:predicted metal-binding protein
MNDKHTIFVCQSCAGNWQNGKPDGVMKWAERPERLRKSVIGIIPSIEIPVSI